MGPYTGASMPANLPPGTPVADDLPERIHYHLRYSLVRDEGHVSGRDVLRAVSLACRELLVDRLFQTERRYLEHRAKRVYYLSMEFLLGRSLANNLLNLGVYEASRRAVAAFGFDLADLLEEEPDPALGNGGLGRLAADFLDSLATLGVPGYGYGINYEFGLFRQVIAGGRQEERPDHWLGREGPWQIHRPGEACLVPVYGQVLRAEDRHGQYNPMWMDWRLIVGAPHDLLISGYGGRTVHTLRLFSARASTEFDMRIFNEGDYMRAVQQKIESETLSKVLYPPDETPSGKELRLLQEWFLVACSLRDILSREAREGHAVRTLPEHVAIQMNDTHPALAVAELMRLLVDEGSLEWSEAWDVTLATCAYTNHTLLPEALESWPVDLVERVLPRHAEIVWEIHHRLVHAAAGRWPGDQDRLRRIAVVQDGRVRMANLAVVGSHSVNGVSALHSALVRRQLFPDYAEWWPERFNNKTNGISQRRWLRLANPELARLICALVGDGWIADFDRLRDLEAHADSPAVCDEFLAVKRGNKARLAALIRRTAGVPIDPTWLFDIHAKRIHQYKRQLLNILDIVRQYLSIVEDRVDPPAPHAYVFAGKAAPGYYLAKLVIQLIHRVADVVNGDPRVRDWMTVAFVPDYRVSVAEVMMPGADLSEQISAAGTEASGTGCMKLAMNGALTIGTLDGANLEMLDALGADNIYTFGLSAEEAARLLRDGPPDPAEHYRTSDDVRRAVDGIATGPFRGDDPSQFQPVVGSVLHARDPFFHLADLDAYIATRRRAATDFSRAQDWARRGLLNVARMGRFSSDRAIREYASDIWGTPAVPVE
jgi:glycogen phosphorylase